MRERSIRLRTESRMEQAKTPHFHDKFQQLKTVAFLGKYFEQSIRLQKSLTSHEGRSRIAILRQKPTRNIFPQMQCSARPASQDLSHLARALLTI